MKRWLKRMMVLLVAAALAAGGRGIGALAAVKQPDSPQVLDDAYARATMQVIDGTIYCEGKAMSYAEITSVTLSGNCEKYTYAGEFVRRKPLFSTTSTTVPLYITQTMQAEEGYVYTLKVRGTVTFADGTIQAISDTATLNY